MTRQLAVASLLLAGLWVTLSCDSPKRGDGPGASSVKSPNANILPAPLTKPQELISKPRPQPVGAPSAATAASAGVPGALAPESVTPTAMPLRHRLQADHLLSHQGLGLQLNARFFWSPSADTAPPPPHQNRAGLSDLAERVQAQVTIQTLATGRLRLRFEGHFHPLPRKTELRSRADMYGHIVVWPSGKQYRPLSAGAIRALLNERRPDVTPLVVGTSEKPTAGPKMMGLQTQVLRLRTNTGSVELREATVDAAGLGGALLCRLLVELISVEPNTPACSPGSLPLRAVYEFYDGARLTFEVSSVAQRTDLDLGKLLVPPRGAAIALAGLPGSQERAATFAPPELLANLRTKPQPHPNHAAGAPEDGLLIQNSSDLMRLFQIDGKDVGWVSARASLLVTGLLPGRYRFRWRTFLGAYSEPSWVDVPTRVRLDPPAYLDGGTLPPQPPNPDPDDDTP